MKNEKDKSTIERVIEKNAFALFLAIISALTAVANLWSISKLAPVTQDLAVISTRVQAVERISKQNVPREEFEVTVNALTDMILNWKNDTDKRLDRIENKIDSRL